jgi:Male sterility protein
MYLLHIFLVVSSAYEPLPGWNDNLNGPSGIVAGSAMGIIRSMNVDLKGTADFVPVDMVANAIITTAKQTAEKKYVLPIFLVYLYNFQACSIKNVVASTFYLEETLLNALDVQQYIFTSRNNAILCNNATFYLIVYFNETR